MTTNIDLLRQRGINTGQVNQLPKALDTRIDYSNLRDLKSVNQSPRMPVATPVQPLSAQQQFFKDFKSPSAPATPTTSSAPSPSALSTAANGLSKALNSPLGKGAGALGLAAALGNEASNLGSSLADVSNEVSGQGNRNRAANQSKRDSNARYEKALADRQKADAANSKGSGTQAGDPNYTPPFSGGQSVGIEYIVTVKAAFSGGEIQFSRGRNPANSIAELQDSTKPVTGAISGASVDSPDNFGTVYYRVNGDLQTYFFAQNFRSSVVISIQIVDITRADRQTDTGGDLGNPNPFTKYYEPPKDFYKNRESTDPNNPKSPNYFPYLPTVKVGGKPDLQPDLSPKDRKDLRPFAEPEKPIFSPTPNPSPSPSPSPVPKLDRPNTGSSNTGSSSNTNSGTSQPYTAPVVDGGVFSPRPYESGKSDPSEYGNPKDIKTGLTRDEFEKAKRAKQNEGATRAAAFDAKAIEEQLRNLPNTVRNGETKSAQQKQREQYENSIKGDPIKENAYKEAQSKASLNVPAPRVTPTPTPTTSPVDLGNIATTLGTIGLAVTAIGQRTTTIQNQTNPVAQQTNAKQGVCDAMQPQQCGFEGVKQATTEATAPIQAQTAANAGLLAQILAAIANLASTMATVLSNLGGKLDGIRQFLEKVARSAKLDKIYGVLTFITVIHNAQMLSNSLATTLMDSLSLGLATIGIKDENESPIDIQSIINKSVEDTVKGIIGTANYTTLSDRWKQAVRVYQAAANITYQVRSLWDSARSLAELTGANVGKIGNALRRDGAVSENAYKAMADNPLMVNNAMSKLQNLEEAASHINSITSETYGVTETVAQIKKDQEDFKKLAKESPSLPSIANDAAKNKDEAAKLVSVSPSISNIDLVKPE